MSMYQRFCPNLPQRQLPDIPPSSWAWDALAGDTLTSVKRHTGRGVVTCLVLLCAVLAGCGASSRSGGSRTQQTGSNTAHPALRVVNAKRSACSSHCGSIVQEGELGERAFIDSSYGVALARTTNGSIYPASTVNRGTTWRIDGPRLYRPAADAPAVVTLVGIARRNVYFVWGGPDGGGAVDVTDDGGRQWWQTFLGDKLLAVVSGGDRLVAIAQSTSGPDAKATTWVYVSTDDGRHWRQTSVLGAVTK